MNGDGIDGDVEQFQLAQWQLPAAELPEVFPALLDIDGHMGGGDSVHEVCVQLVCLIVRLHQ